MKVFTTGQVAKICKVAPRTVSKWFDSGALHGYRIPGSKDRRIPLNQLIRFMKQHGMPLNGLMTGSTLHGKALRPASGHRVELCVYVQDVDRAFAELVAAGAPPVVEPCDQPWGERMAYVEDPDGNLVMLTAPLR